MKIFMIFALLGLAASSLMAVDDGGWKRTECNANNVGSTCTRWDESAGICKQQTCATMTNPSNICYVCAPK